MEPTTEFERQLLARNAELERLLRAALDANAEHSRRLIVAESRIAELEALLRTNSQNSSKPPSTDVFRRATPPKPVTGRKASGQPGHKGVTRDLVPEDLVDKLVDLDPDKCVHCSTPLEAMQQGNQNDSAIPSLVERFRNVAISASKSRVMGDCQARRCTELVEVFRERPGCDSPAYSIIPLHGDLGIQLLKTALFPGAVNRVGYADVLIARGKEKNGNY